MKININSHSSIQIDDIYFDPFQIKRAKHNAKYIFITHTHYDHLSIEDIDKIITLETVIIATPDAKQTLEEKYQNKIIYVKPNDNISLSGIEVEVLPAYNLNKEFHKKSSKWVGYKIIYGGTSFAVLGDTDNIPELSSLECDYLFVPIGGTYTMNAVEAATLSNIVKPKFVIPTHYNAIVGTKKDEQTFLKNLDKGVGVKLLI